MSTIIVRNLCKDYRYYEKETGLRSSVKNLFARKTLVRHAVRDLSFANAPFLVCV